MIKIEDENVNVNVEELKQKVHFFCINKKPVHLSMKKNYWLNGTITEESADFFLLKDLKTSAVNPIFYLEIFDLRAFEDKNEKEGEGK